MPTSCSCRNSGFVEPHNVTSNLENFTAHNNEYTITAIGNTTGHTCVQLRQRPDTINATTEPAKVWRNSRVVFVLWRTSVHNSDNTELNTCAPVCLRLNP